MRSILTTVGTSLIANTRRSKNIDSPSNSVLLAYLRETTPAKASAETNSLSKLLKPGDRIVFLHSHTDEGLRCGSVFQEYYRYSGYPSELREIPDLAYSESRFKILGLRSLVANLVELIMREQNSDREVLINATGGFKAESAYATLVGLIFDVPVYYIHEAFQDIIEMPAIPINWDYSLIECCKDFLDWIDADLRLTKHVESRIRRLPNEIRMLLVESDGYTYLSPAGEVLYRAYRAALSSASSCPIELSRQAAQTYAAATPSARARFDSLIAKMRIPVHRTSGSARVGKSDCLVYPRDNRAERIFYYMDKDTLRVCELSEHGGSYERLLESGVFKKDYLEFMPHTVVLP